MVELKIIVKNKKEVAHIKNEFTKKLLSIVLPITFGQFMLAVVSASDALMLGLLSQDALSAVSLAGQISFVESLFLAAMSIGLSMLASQYWGKGDRAAVERIFAYVMKITAIISFVFFIASLFIPSTLMKIFTKEEVLIQNGITYLKNVSLSFLLTGISQIYIAILKNSGKAIKVSIISFVSVMTNIILNAILIFGLFGLPKLGIAGAAIATVISKIIELIWCILESNRFNSIKLKLKNLINDDTILKKDFWKYSSPILGNQISWGVGFTMYSVIMGHLGSDAVAANSIASTIKGLVVCFCVGLSNGGAIMIGNELGAARLERAKDYGRRLERIAIIYGVIAGLIMISLIPIILKFTELSDVATHYLKWMILISSLYMVGKSVNTLTISGIFAAGGDSKFGFICDTITMWCFSVPLGFITAFILKLPVLAVYTIINLDEIVKLPAVYKHYKKYNWVKDLTNHNKNREQN